MLSSFHFLLRGIAQLEQRLFPSVCLGCQLLSQKTQPLCEGCKQQLPRIIQCCQRCGLVLPNESFGLCGQCLRSPPPYDRLRTLWAYESLIPQWITDLKFRGKLYYAHCMGELLAEYLAETLEQLPDKILPVPLHWQRLGVRGFNQAIELARPIEKRLQRPLLLNNYRRQRYTKPQTSMSAQARRKNMRNAFIKNKSLAGCSVAIVDDVITTGSTVASLAKQLRQDGVTRIEVWGCARA